MARIRIFIARHLCTAPRPQKEAAALAAAGHDVVVHGVWFDPRLAARDESIAARQDWSFVPAADCRPLDRVRRWRWFRQRARHRLARLLYGRTGKVTPDLFGYAHADLARLAASAPADLAIFHSEGGLWMAERLRQRGRRVGLDFEDWFSEDLAADARQGRPVAELRRWERSLLRHAGYVLAPSRAMARALAADAQCNEPAVIYNTFPAAPAAAAGLSPDRRDPARRSLHWFSLVIGPDRGLETLAGALHDVPAGCEIHLRGDGPEEYRTHWRALVPAAHRPNVHFHPTVANAELPGRIAGHDIGLALDVNRIPSRNLTITNKLFQYLQGGLAIVASDTAGHREVITAAPAAGLIFGAEDSAALGRALNLVLADSGRLEQMKTAAARAAATTFSHERQQSRYAELAAAALAAPADPRID